MILATAALAASLLRPAFTAAPPGPLGTTAWRAATHEHFGNTDVYLLEDGDYVYIAFSAPRADRDAGDAVRVYLWSDKAAYSFSVDANGHREGSASVGPAPQWTAQERSDANGYEVTMRFPRALFAARSQSRWLAQFARVLPEGRVAYTWPQSQGEPGNVIDSVRFDPSHTGAFTAAAREQEPEVASAAHAERIWPAQGSPALAAPAIPADAKGVALAQNEHSISFAGVAAKSEQGEQNAQSVAWKSPDGRASAGAARTASSDDSATDVEQALAFQYDNLQNMRFRAGVASQAGTNVTDASQATFDYYDFVLYGKKSSLEMRWNAAGPQYDAADEQAPAPGTAGYTLSLSRAFGTVSLDASADRYRDDFGNLTSAQERAAISAALSPSLTFDVNAATDAAPQFDAMPYAQSGADLSYRGDGRDARLSYHEEHFRGGEAREASLSTGFKLPVLGTLRLQHSQTAVHGTASNILPSQSSSASVVHTIAGGYLALGYQNASGDANITLSFEDRLPIGLLRATYYNPTTPLASPNFSVKLIPL